MLYQRGTVDSFSKWAELVNDTSYLFPNVLPYYKKSPQYTPFNASLYTNSTNTQSPTSFSSSGGPLQVSFPKSIGSFATWAQRAFQAFGMGPLPGFNDGALLGSAYATSTIDPTTGLRSSSSSSFLATALLRSLAPTIYTNTLASRLLFSASTPPRAAAVLATTAGTFGTPSLTYTLAARRSIILSAGAIQSPQLLQVSGIGNCSALARHAIPCVSHLPGVGANLWDHPIFGTSHRVRLTTASAAASNATVVEAGVAAFLEGAGGGGPLAQPGAGVYGWEKLPASANLSAATREALGWFPPDWPEVEWLPSSALRGDGNRPEHADPGDGTDYATISTVLVAPLSRGSVRVESGEMGVPPVIDPAWLAEEGDREVAVRCVRRQREMWGWLVEQGVAEEEEVYPGEEVQTDEEILEWLRESLSTVNHASCTCKMGTRGDPMTVLDGEARVFGVDGLRVVDASSFPLLVPGHPQSTVYMLAEKIAEKILEEEGMVANGNLSLPMGDSCIG